MQFDKSTGLGETLISEMPGPRAEVLQHTNSMFMFEGEGVPLKEVVNRENFVQNREEFLGDVHQDNANSKISMRLPVTGRNHENGVGIYQQCYEDLTANLALRRMDSGCSAHVLDFDSAMGSMENGIYFNNNCGVPGKDTAFGQGATKPPPTVNGFDQANSSLGVQHLAEDSASLQGLKNSSDVNQSSASAPNLTELESAQSSSQSHNEISGGLQSKKIKFLCGFGGKILPRPSDGKLRYVGGETRMVTIRTNITWAELVQKTSELCNQPHTIKYQLPGEELDALISVSSDEDLQNMIEEYYSGEKLGSSQRLRIFLIPLIEPDDQSGIDTSDVQQSDPDYQYVVAVNGVTRVDSNLSEYSNEKAMETDLSHLTSTLDRNTSFQENTLSSWNPSQSVNILNGSTQLMNGPQDTISPAIHCAPLPPVTIQQRDLKNGFSLLHKAKLSPDSSEGLPLFTTVASPPEIYSNHVPSSHNFPTLRGTSNANKNGALGVQVSQMNSPVTQILPMPILELRGHKQECSSDRPVVEERVLHSEKPFPFPDDTMNVICESKNSIPANHGMPHAFSDSKLQEYGISSTYSSQEGINQYFSLNSPKPPLSVSADLLEKPIQLFQQNEDVGFSNPYLKSKTSSAEQVFHNQGPNFINFSFDSESDKDTEPVPWDISINRQNLQSVISASYEHRCIIREQEENCSNSKLIDDTVKQFDDKNSTAGALETLDFYVDQTFYVGNNNQQQSISESRELEPPSICLKPSKKQLVNKQLLLTESPRGVPGSNQSNINQLETAEIVNNCAQTSSDVNLVTDLLSGLCSSLVSLESSGRQPFSCSNHMGMENSILMNCTQPPSSAVIETEKEYQNAHVRREYSLIDDDWSFNNNGIQRLELQDNCTGNLQNSSAVVLDELKVPMSTSYSRTTQHTVDVVHAAYPSPSTIEAERTLEELLSAADEHFEDGSNGQISDATKAEKEAEEYGLQIIKNSDLEDLRELGSGTYGTVYHGRWKGTDVAIKRIRKTCFSGRLSQQERLTKDFWKEALVLSKLHHPNIVAFYGAGGTLATVTEYMSHGSLRSVLAKKDRFLDYRRKLRITMDSAFGMEYLHSRNIIHFDLKCDNLLVSLRDPERPVCKVGDFGLSKIKQNTLVSGGVRGSLPWMAPELLSGSTDLVSDKVDVFSFGISMWEILTGEEPYKNMHCGLIIGGIIKNTLRPPIPERCDPEWRKLMEQCWSINPEERPSFTEISNRLRSMYALLEDKGKSNQQTKA